MDPKLIEAQIVELDRRIEEASRHLKVLKKARRKAQAMLEDPKLLAAG